MSLVSLPATFTALMTGLKFWEDKKSLSVKKIKDRDDAVNVVLAALILTKSYLYDRRELKIDQDRSREEKLSQAWQEAANAIYRFDKTLFQSAKVKALSWADPREWLKAEEQGIEVKLETLIKQCEWLKEQKT
jgi:hypothetical protein